MGGFHLFTLAKVPVWVSPWFLVVPLYATRSLGAQDGLLFALCLGLSVLAHEFGHALVANRYKLSPQIMIHAFGGETGHQRASTNGQDALIVVAGPSVGLLLGVLCMGVLVALSPVSISGQVLVDMALGQYVGAPLPPVVNVLSMLIFLNIFYSLVNLLPVWPMDGGKLFRLGMLKLMKPTSAERVTYSVGLFGVAVLALLVHVYWRLSFFTIFILGTMAFDNIKGLSQGSSEPVRKENGFARELLLSAERAYERGEDDEAARICHQIRAEGSVPPPVLARTWAMLGVIATRKGEYEEALSYLRRAPDGLDVVEATAQCFYQLGMTDALTALTATKAFNRLPNDTRRAILDALHESEPA
jgi:stage IV sporulation protein FB